MSAQVTETKPESSGAAEPAEGRQSLRRRGILAALWALAAGFVAKQTTQPVEASTAMLIANTETGGVSNSAVGHSIVVGGGSSVDAVLIGDSGTGSARAGIMGTTLATYTPTEFSAVYGLSNNAHVVLVTPTVAWALKDLRIAAMACWA